MNTPPPADLSDHEGFSDSDFQWFERLGGLPVVVGDARALQEADELRHAFSLQREALENDADLQEALSAPAQQRDWEALQFRLRAEGLGSSQASLARTWLPWLGGMAATVALATMLVPLWRNDSTSYDEPPVMRGEFQEVHRVDSDPRAAAQSLADALQAVGVTAHVHRKAELYSVDIDLSTTKFEAAKSVLVTRGIPETTGITRVVFAPQ